MSVPDISMIVERKVAAIGMEMKSRAVRGSQALNNAEIYVLTGGRGGRAYKKPGTYGKEASPATKELLDDYGHRLEGGQLYRASAPGEVPAVRSGTLWRSFEPVASSAGGGSLSVKASIESNLNYAGYLENGTIKMAARPYVEKIKQEALPEVAAIFNEPYNV